MLSAIPADPLTYRNPPLTAGLGRFAGADRRACSLLTGDRRPVDALRFFNNTVFSTLSHVVGEHQFHVLPDRVRHFLQVLPVFRR